MQRNSGTIIDSSREFFVNELFFSTTDRKGLIQSCNGVFLRVADFPPEELIGSPHNIVRHQHMPRCVFKLLWDYLLGGKEIGAYVKNRARTGEYYWVFALATPIEDGFLSVRLKPTSDLFAAVPGVYDELLKVELSHGSDWRSGMQASEQRLGEILNSLGFSSYDGFMNEAFKVEMQARERQLAATGSGAEESGKANELDCRAVFAKVETLDSFQGLLREKKDFFDTAVQKLALLSINLAVMAAQIGKAGRTLAVVADEVARISTLVTQEAKTFTENHRALAGALETATLSVSLALLQDEMASLFRKEKAEFELSEAEQTRRYGKPMGELIALLEGRSETLKTRAVERFRQLGETLGRFLSGVEALSKVVKNLRFAQVTGKVEAELAQGAGYATLLEQLDTVAGDIQANLRELSKATHLARDSVRVVGRGAPRVVHS